MRIGVGLKRPNRKAWLDLKLLLCIYESSRPKMFDTDVSQIPNWYKKITRVDVELVTATYSDTEDCELSISTVEYRSHMCRIILRPV